MSPAHERDTRTHATRPCCTQRRSTRPVLRRIGRSTSASARSPTLTRAQARARTRTRTRTLTLTLTQANWSLTSSSACSTTSSRLIATRTRRRSHPSSPRLVTSPGPSPQDYRTSPLRPLAASLLSLTSLPVLGSNIPRWHHANKCAHVRAYACARDCARTYVCIGSSIPRCEDTDGSSAISFTEFCAYFDRLNSLYGATKPLSADELLVACQP